MSKLRTAIALLLSGSAAQFCSRLRLNLRSLRLRWSDGQPFIYSLEGSPFVCVPGIPDSEDTYLAGEVDRLELTVLSQWLEPGDACVDVGANLGLYTFAACNYLGGRGVFLAIEASNELTLNLRFSAELLSLINIQFEQTAVGDAVKEVTFYSAPPGGATGEQGLYPDHARFPDFVPRRVPMSTLSEISQRLPAFVRPAAVKIDIEGAEPFALQGAPPEWLGPTGPLWIAEVNPTALERAGSSCETLVAHFLPSCFECWLSPQFARTGLRVLPVRALTPEESFSDAWFYNLIAMPKGANFTARRRRVSRILSSAT